MYGVKKFCEILLTVLLTEQFVSIELDFMILFSIIPRVELFDRLLSSRFTGAG